MIEYLQSKKYFPILYKLIQGKGVATKKEILTNNKISLPTLNNYLALLQASGIIEVYIPKKVGRNRVVIMRKGILKQLFLEYTKKRLRKEESIIKKKYQEIIIKKLENIGEETYYSLMSLCTYYYAEEYQNNQIQSLEDFFKLFTELLVILDIYMFNSHLELLLIHQYYSSLEQEILEITKIIDKEISNKQIILSFTALQEIQEEIIRIITEINTKIAGTDIEIFIKTYNKINPVLHKRHDKLQRILPDNQRKTLIQLITRNNKEIARRIIKELERIRTKKGDKE